MPYSRYRSLRLDNIRSALGLGRRPSEATAAPPAPPTSIELPQKENNPPSANPPSPLAGPKSGSATPGKGGAKGETDPQRFPPHSPISGIQWGFPVAPHQDPTSDNPQKSAFHQSCDPVLQSQQAMQDKYENLMSDTASTTTGVVTTAAPSEAGESAVDDSRPPTRGSEAPTVGSEVPTVGAEDSTGATAPPPAPPSEAPSGLSRLSCTASGEEEHFVEPKYLRPGDEDGDALLVEPTHGRIEGYESKPAASPSAEGSRKVVEHEGDSITLGKRPKSAQAAEPSGKRIMVEDTPVALGGKYRTPEGAGGRPAKNLLRFEDAQLKLGKGYQTRGRNE